MSNLVKTDVAYHYTQCPMSLRPMPAWDACAPNGPLDCFISM